MTCRQSPAGPTDYTKSRVQKGLGHLGDFLDVRFKATRAAVVASPPGEVAGEAARDAA